MGRTAESYEEEISILKTEIKRLKDLINDPEIDNFIEGVKIEAPHQTERWGKEKEESAPPHHYVLVITKLLGKLTVAIWDKDVTKFKHHCITIAAAMLNCHRQIENKNTFINEYFYKK